MTNSRYLFALVLIAAGGAFSVPRSAVAQPASKSEFERMHQLPSAQGGSSDIERDPFRACVAAHPSDPNVQQNCTWEGKYQPKQ